MKNNLKSYVMILSFIVCGFHASAEVSRPELRMQIVELFGQNSQVVAKTILHSHPLGEGRVYAVNVPPPNPYYFQPRIQGNYAAPQIIYRAPKFSHQYPGTHAPLQNGDIKRQFIPLGANTHIHLDHFKPVARPIYQPTHQSAIVPIAKPTRIYAAPAIVHAPIQNISVTQSHSEGRSQHQLGVIAGFVPKSQQRVRPNPEIGDVSGLKGGPY